MDLTVNLCTYVLRYSSFYLKNKGCIKVKFGAGANEFMFRLQVNEVLNVASLSLTTSTISDSVAKTAVQALETKINEILAKSTLTC